MSYKVEVTTGGDGGKYSTNALRFATVEEARAYGDNLASRWLAIKDWRVAESEDEVTDVADDIGNVTRKEG